MATELLLLDERPGIIMNQALAKVLTYDGRTWNASERDLLKDPTPPGVCYIFLEDRDLYKERWTVSERRKILNPFNVPQYLANQLCTDINGFFGCRSSLDADETLVDLSLWFRCLVKVVLKPEEGRAPDGKPYWWHEMGFFVRWNPHECKVLCIGTPLALREQLRSTLQESPLLESKDPFAMVSPLFDQIIILYDQSVWRVRNYVRAQEMNRGRKPCDFEAIHDISRHASHLVEVHAATIETMEQMLHRQRSIYERILALDQTSKLQAHEYIGFQLQMMKSLHRRSISLRERIGLEANLAYNIIALQDNAMMKSIALLTMILLPATFISALFSTTFFSFSENKWNMSKSFWIYWAVAIPSTLAVLVLWWLSFKRSSMRNRSG